MSGTRLNPPSSTPVHGGVNGRDKKSSPTKSLSSPKTPTEKFDERIKQFEVQINLNKLFGRWLPYLLIGILFLPFLLSLAPKKQIETIALSAMVADIRDKKVSKLEISGAELKATYADESVKSARKEEGQSATELLKDAGVDITTTQLTVIDHSRSQIIYDVLLNIVPVLLMLGLLFFLFRQARGGQDGILGIGRSKAKIFIKGKQSTKFNDVGGMDEAKQELQEIVDFMKNPKKYKKVGARTPKGVLLVGPAGTGKTLLARAVAGEAGVQFLSIAGSEFMEMLVGVGASRVRDLFTTAKKIAPAIIFIDEIDAIGRVRGFGSMGGHDEREQTLNQILVEMDGFTPNDNVIVMAATNRGDMLDPALVRPGRFDRRVSLNLPDLEERKFILNIHAKGKPFVKDLDWAKIARRTVGFSGADIENMLNEAAIGTARGERDQISTNDIEEAALKVKLGPSKRRLQNPLEKKITAYHEAGHAVIAHLLPNADPVHRISIVSRGQALGFTFTPPERDKLQLTKSEIEDELAVLLGGRAAEELIFNEQTAGASSDIERATRLARAMVVDYGMSPLGPMQFGPQYESNNFQRAWGEPAKISDRLQEKVDTAITDIINAAQLRAAKLLKQRRTQLDQISEKLLEVETLDGDEFAKLMGEPKVKPNATFTTAHT